MKKTTINEFIYKAEKIHCGFYSYNLSNYKNCSTKIEIVCPIHGNFWQTPDAHINQQQKCPSCVGLKKLTT